MVIKIHKDDQEATKLNDEDLEYFNSQEFEDESGLSRV